MAAQVALFFLLDSSKASAPQNYGMQLPTQSIAPFYDSLNDDSRFAKLNYPDATIYAISYFKKPFVTDMMVVVRELGSHSKSTLIANARTQLAKILKVNENSFYLLDYQYRALWLAKGVQRQEFVNLMELFSGEGHVGPDTLPRYDTKDYWVMNHRDGFVFGGKNEQDFTRALAFFGLALAYHHQFSLQINRLAHAADHGGDALLSLRQEALRFRAHYFFGNPVRPGNRDAFGTYAHIIRALDLVPVEQELARKLNDTGNLIQVKQARAQLGSADEVKWAEKLRNELRAQPQPGDAPAAKGGGRIGYGRIVLLLVVIVLAVSALQLSPQQYAELLHSWIAFFTGGGSPG